jgi:hypothetical protein
MEQQVFANDRQAAVAAVKYDPASAGVCLIGGGAALDCPVT